MLKIIIIWVVSKSWSFHNSHIKNDWAQIIVTNTVMTKEFEINIARMTETWPRDTEWAHAAGTVPADLMHAELPQTFNSQKSQHLTSVMCFCQNSQKHQRKVVSIYRNNVSRGDYPPHGGPKRHLLWNLHALKSLILHRPGPQRVGSTNKGGGGSVFQFLSEHPVLGKSPCVLGTMEQQQIHLSCAPMPHTDSNSLSFHRGAHTEPNESFWEKKYCSCRLKSS